MPKKDTTQTVYLVGGAAALFGAVVLFFTRRSETAPAPPAPPPEPEKMLGTGEPAATAAWPQASPQRPVVFAPPPPSPLAGIYATPPAAGARWTPLPWSEIRVLFRLVSPTPDLSQRRPLSAYLTAAEIARAEAQLRALGYVIAPGNFAHRTASLRDVLARANAPRPPSDAAGVAFLDNVYRVARGGTPVIGR